MKLLALVATLAISTLASPSERPSQRPELCAPGSYRCHHDSKSIDVCAIGGSWQEAGACPSGTVCEELPDNESALPYCVDKKSRRDGGGHRHRHRNEERGATPCTPASYVCARGHGSGGHGIRVCDTEQAWEYVGDCPAGSRCEYFSNGIPYCVSS